jgi:hypothetical protein
MILAKLLYKRKGKRGIGCYNAILALSEHIIVVYSKCDNFSDYG